MHENESDDDGIDVYFAAARRHAPPPPGAGLMTRILADAADVSVARAPRPGRTAVLGWPAAAALGFCAAIGLAAGLLGGAETGSTALWEAASATEPEGEILAFYDLASLED